VWIIECILLDVVVKVLFVCFVVVGLVLVGSVIVVFEFLFD